MFLGPEDLDSISMRPERVRAAYKSSTHRQLSIGALLERVIITQEGNLQDIKKTRLYLEPEPYDRAPVIKEAGFLADLSDRPAVMEAVSEQLAALFQSDVLKSLPPRQDLASHIYTTHLSQSLMIKLVVEQKQGCIVPLEGKYNGLLLLWLLTGHCLLIEPSDMVVNGGTASQVYRLHADRLVPHSGLPCALGEWYANTWISSAKTYTPQKQYESHG